MAEEYECCIENIVRSFFYDTLELTDCVLEDDENDPHFSPTAVYQRFDDLRIFLNQHHKASFFEQLIGIEKQEISSVEQLLRICRYSNEDIENLLERIKREEEFKQTLLAPAE